MLTLVDLLRNRASQHSDKVAYTFLEDGEREVSSFTYRQLDEKARAIAAYLQAQLSPGDRVLLVYPQGLEAIAALFGCLYAGMVAIPAPAPEPLRLKRTLPRLEAIAADAGASLVLTTTRLLTQRSGGFTFQAKSVVGRVRGQLSLLLHYYLVPLVPAGNGLETSHFTSLPWVGTETIPAQWAAQWQAPDICGATLAYLQYTSGSTSTPKGVMLDYANLMRHLAALRQAGGYDTHSMTVTWMPYFHDYGLVEGMLLPLYNGTPCYMMSPLAFIKQPMRWLQAISRYGATHSQAPNFAYAYCLRRIGDIEGDGLDLSGWQAAGNAAEPINPRVMEAFCQRFAACGFDRWAFAPAYGLAEATLLVTTSRKLAAPVVCTVETGALASHRVVEAETGQTLAGSGQMLPGTQVVIVQPETLTRCAENEVGEIWVASAGVARGYWQRPEATRETFGAYLADTGAGPFLRTGDLGFVKDGELFVTGRLKDLIIIRGENYYPQDIEWVVESCHAALRPGYGAAFAAETDDGEQLVIAFEVESRASRDLNADEVMTAIRNAIAEHYELPVYGVVLLKRGSIPKTSSGKIQRRACRQAFLAGDLEAIASWDVSAIKLSATEHLGQDSVNASPLNLRIAAIWQEVLEVAVIQRTDNFFELGGDSLKAAILVSEIGVQCRVNLELSAIAEAPTLNEFVQLVQAQGSSKPPSCLVPVRATGNKIPFFYVHGLGGSSLGAKKLIPYFDPERPVYGLNAVGLQDDAEPHTRMDDMVQHYIQEIRTVQPEGPYLLGGQCFGGNLAFEMARQLMQQGKTVLLVAMADSLSPIWAIGQERLLEEHWQTTGRIEFQEKLKKQGLSTFYIEKILKIQESNRCILSNYSPQVYSGRVVYFSAEKNQHHDFGFGDDGKNFARKYLDPMQPGSWNDWIEGGVEVVKVPGRHGTYHNPPHVQVYAEKLNAYLKQVEKVLLS